MIVDKRFHLGLLAAGSAPALAMLLAYDILITIAYCGLDWHFESLPNIPLSLLGSAIALIVPLRNSVAYGRWWEGRTLWSAVVNNSRGFARAADALR